VTVEIVILAMIAAFLGLRLYSVLGRRAEHEEEPIAGRLDPRRGAANTPRVAAPAKSDDNANGAANTNVRQRELPAYPPAVERGLRDITSADRRFDAVAFLDGARGAYRMILEAYWAGNKAELREFCDDDVYEAFAGAIDARAEAGETLNNRLIRIEDTSITAAGMDGNVARITVRFRSDIAAVTRNSDGAVIAGSLDDAIEAIDVWTFSRNVTSADPDWLLDETDEG
jgi:predicted lipid-binding transport protein (Tim44 family)